MEIPVACTLAGGELADRLASWASLQPALRSVTRHDGALRVAFDAAAGARRLAELVAAEAACCAFVDWQLVSDGEELVVVITGSDTGVAAVAELFPGAAPS